MRLTGNQKWLTDCSLIYVLALFKPDLFKTARANIFQFSCCVLCRVKDECVFSGYGHIHPMTPDGKCSSKNHWICNFHQTTHFLHRKNRLHAVCCRRHSIHSYFPLCSSSGDKLIRYMNHIFFKSRLRETNNLSTVVDSSIIFFLYRRRRQRVF